QAFKPGYASPKIRKPALAGDRFQSSVRRAKGTQLFWDWETNIRVQSCERDIEGRELRVMTPGQLSQPCISHLLQSNHAGKRYLSIAETVVTENMIRHGMNRLQNGPCGGGCLIFGNCHVDAQQCAFVNHASCERFGL